MEDASWDREALVRPQYDPFILKIDNELSAQGKEELVFLIVLVPMEFAFLKYADPDNTIVYLAERLIVPFLFHARGKRWNIHEL